MKVLLSDSLSPAGIAILQREAGLQVENKPGLKKEQLLEAVADADALVVRSSTKVTKEILAAARKLKVIGRAGVGLDNVDVEEATKKGIVVMNTPEGNTITTAEHAVTLIMAMSRFIPQATSSMKQGQWEKKKFQGVEVYRKVLGIIGLGRIGTEVARRMKEFGMQVIAYDPFISLETARTKEVEVVSFQELLSRADYITLHIPLTPETHHLIGEKAFAAMKPGVRIVNCARGGVIDEAALCQAVESGKVAGAALDVFEQEPPDPDNPLFKHWQVVCTPHLGANTVEAQEKVALAMAQQVADFLMRGIIVNAVNMPSISREKLLDNLPYISLVERMARLLAQLTEGRVKRFSITYSGEVLSRDTNLFTMAAIKGLLEPILGESVNYVNAPVIARERGIEVMEAKQQETSGYTSLMSLRLETDRENRSISGTLFSRRDPRIVQLDDFSIEAIPKGDMLVLTNQDTPGVIGSIGRTLGEAGVNIGRMQLGRDVQGGRAISLVNVDSAIPAEVLQKLESLPKILTVKAVRV